MKKHFGIRFKGYDLISEFTNIQLIWSAGPQPPEIRQVRLQKVLILNKFNTFILKLNYQYKLPLQLINKYISKTNYMFKLF